MSIEPEKHISPQSPPQPHEESQEATQASSRGPILGEALPYLDYIWITMPTASEAKFTDLKTKRKLSTSLAVLLVATLEKKEVLQKYFEVHFSALTFEQLQNLNTLFAQDPQKTREQILGAYKSNPRLVYAILLQLASPKRGEKI